jgi:rod shape determining protein RodA
VTVNAWAHSRAREHFDWPLFLSVVTIAVMGVVNLYSATSPYLGDPRRSGLADIYVQQVYWLVVGGLLGILTAVIDYRTIERFAYALYIAGVGMLVLVFWLASDIRGSSRWIDLGRFTFQPSEFMKLFMVLAMARKLAEDSRTEAKTLMDLLLALVRLRRSSLVGFVAGLVPLCWAMWNFILRDYQKNRILSFLNPEADKIGTGWHAFQSRTAIGNGGLWGEGFREGTQNQFGFLPDQFSDFPFSVFAEDWGFVGCLALLFLYAFVCAWAINIASLAKDRFGAAVAVGIGALFFWHTLFNIGMTLGILPVVGITLPLFSYGGSSVVTTLVGFGLLMNVSLRR